MNMNKLRLKYKPLLLCVLAVLASWYIAAPSPALAQQSFLDLAVEVEVNNTNGVFRFYARNLGTQDAYGVTVRIDLPDQVVTEYSHGFDPSTGVWHVGRLDAGDSETIYVATKMAPELVSAYPSRLAVPARAVISNSFPMEPPVFLHNNSAEGWTVVSPTNMIDAAGGNYRLTASLDNPQPQDGDTVNLVIKMILTGLFGHIADAYGVKVLVRLPPGLGQPTATLPSGPGFPATTFSPVPGEARTWEWNVGFTTRRLDLGLSLPVNSRAEVEGKCITADLTVERPYDHPMGNHVKLCFGEPPFILLQDGKINLFTLYPCVGVTTYPCTSADTLESVVQVGSVAEESGFLYPDAVLQPHNVIVHVPHIAGRVVDSNSNSVNAGSAASWQTANTRAPPADGVTITLSLSEFNDELSNWNNVVRTMSASGVIDAGAVDQVCDTGDPSPPCAPGRMKIRFNSTGNVFFDPNPTHRRLPLSLSISRNPSAIFAEFEKLGTYVVKYTATATHTDTTNHPDGITGTGTYTFHVGPVAELEVREGAPRQGAAWRQRAFAIEAVNNGLDTAPAARVTVSGLDLNSYVTYEATAGTFDPLTGVWDIGGLDTRDGGEALTIVTSGSAPNAELTATIRNDEVFSLCIDGSGDDVLPKPANEGVCEATSGNIWHATNYLDYIDENNAATIGLRRAVGEAPILMEREEYSAATRLRWQPVDRVLGWPVSRYELQWSPDGVQFWTTLSADIRHTHYVDVPARPGEPRYYRVRGINSQGMGGLWSLLEGSGAPVAPGAPPGLILSTNGLTLAENGGEGTYTVILSGKPADEVTVSISSDDTDVVRVSPETVTFAPDEWNIPQAITATAQDDNLLNPGGGRTATIRHTVSGGGRVNLGVTVTDNDQAATGLELSVSPQDVAEECKRPEDENCGPTRVEVTATLLGPTRFPEAQTVNVSVHGSGRENVVGFRPVSDFRITIPAGQATGAGAFTLTPLDDRVDQETEVVTVSGTAEGLAVGVATLRLSDGDAQPHIYVRPGPEVCGGDPATFTLELDTNPNAPGLQPYDQDVLVNLRILENRQVLMSGAHGVQVPILAGETSSEPLAIDTKEPHYKFSQSEHLITDDDLAAYGIPTDRRPRYPLRYHLEEEKRMPGHDDDIFKWANQGKDVVDSADPDGPREAGFLEYLQIRVVSSRGPGSMVVKVEKGNYIVGERTGDDEVLVHHSSSFHPSCNP